MTKEHQFLIALYVVVGATGLLSEWLMAKKYNYKVTESLFVRICPIVI